MHRIAEVNRLGEREVATRRHAKGRDGRRAGFYSEGRPADEHDIVRAVDQLDPGSGRSAKKQAVVWTTSLRRGGRHGNS